MSEGLHFFQKFVYLLMWFWELTVISPPLNRTNQSIFVMESKCFCSVGTGFTCWLDERNAWRVILSRFLYTFLYFLFLFLSFLYFLFYYLFNSFFPFSLFRCIFFIHARSLNCEKRLLAPSCQSVTKTPPADRFLWTFILGC